jgi:hypothetical protein
MLSKKILSFYNKIPIAFLIFENPDPEFFRYCRYPCPDISGPAGILGMKKSKINNK